MHKKCLMITEFCIPQMTTTLAFNPILSGCYFGIPLPFPLKHGFCSESEQPSRNWVNIIIYYTGIVVFCGIQNSVNIKRFLCM